MADLIHRFTQQIVQGVNKEEFLAGVHDAIDWIEHKAEEACEAVEQLFTPELASDMPAVETVAYADGVSATGAAPLPEQSPEAEAQAVETPAVEIPAEAAAIAAEPEQH